MENSAKLNLDSCKFEGVHFYKISTETKLDIPIIKEFADVFQKTLPGLPPRGKLNAKLRSLVSYLNKHQSTKYLLLKTNCSKST